MSKLNILCVMMKFDYGDPARGFSFEHWNFHESLVQMGHEVSYFDFMSHYKQLGKRKMNQLLWETVKSDRPDLLFAMLFREELDRRILRRISEETDTVSLNWFCDDHWRFNSFSRIWAPCFNWVVTTAKSALPKYRAIGYENAIMSQWGVNHHLYRKLDLPLAHDVSFIGQPHGNRRQLIEGLRSAGIDVKVWGHGWENGRVSQEQMIRIFNQSRINLNLANASTNDWRRPPPSFIAIPRSKLSQALDRVELGRRLKSWRARRVRRAKASIVLPEQIKARNFEVPGCGGFCLTSQAENLADYFKIGDQVACYSGLENLIENIRHYLDHESERAAIASAGYRRTIEDHTYERRFERIFRTIGLS